MANEIDTGANAGEMIQAEILSRQIIPAAYGPSLMLGLSRIESLIGQISNTGEYTKHPLLTASALTDGVAVANSDYDPTSVTVSTAEVGLSLEITDLFAAGAIINANDLATQAGFAVANRIDTDLLAEAADFTTTVGTSTQDLTNANILSAVYEVKNKNLLNYGTIHGVLHPIQVFDWFSNIASLTGNVIGTEGFGGFAPFQVGRTFSLYGIMWHESTLCASVNTDEDRQGAVFPSGQLSPFLYQLKWAPRAEMERDAKMRSWSAVVTAAYGDEVVDTVNGVAVITDHE